MCTDKEKEKRVTVRFNLENERDREIYEALSDSNLKMSRIIKDLLYTNLVDNKETEIKPALPVINSTQNIDLNSLVAVIKEQLKEELPQDQEAQKEEKTLHNDVEETEIEDIEI